jgi:hypothetical protein
MLPPLHHPSYHPPETSVVLLASPPNASSTSVNTVSLCTIIFLLCH